MPDETGQNHYDVAIVGGGPAGLSAGVWLGRYLYDVALFDSGDPRNWQTEEIHGVLGHTRVRPANLRKRGRDQCRDYDVDLVDAHVDDIDRSADDEFVLQTDEATTFTARRILLAMGIRDYWPDIPGLERCYGTTVHTCPNCDGYESQNTPTAVIGHGPKAASVALALTTWTRRLAILTNGREPTFDEAARQALEDLDIDIHTRPVERLEQDHKHLRMIDFTDGRTLECEHLFIAMGQHARDDVGAQLGCQRNQRGFITIDEYHHTSVRNVFAAGDITPGAQLAVRAAAGGAEAALSIHHSLIPADRRVHRDC